MGVSKRKTEKHVKKETVKEEPLAPVSPYLQVARLPRYEAWFNIIAWSGFVAYFCYSAYVASQEYVVGISSPYLVPGYSFLGRQRDVSNSEWEFMRGWAVVIWPWFTVHILLSLVVRQVAFEYRFYILSEYGAVIVIYLMGFKPVLFLVAQCLILYLTAAIFKSVLAVWTVTAGFLVMLNVQSITMYLLQLVPAGGDPNVLYYLLIYGMSMSNMRYTSFCLEQCKHLRATKGEGQQDRGGGYSFLDMLVYMFYLPVMFSGPLMTYDRFLLQKTQPKQPWTKPQVVSLIKDALRIVFWTLFIEVLLHYMYFNALMNDPELLGRLPRWALVGVGYCMGQFFMVKYLVIFGLPKVLTEFDQIRSADRPKCISRIYLYSEMWKNFDAGLYSFMKRHIYVPLGGSRNGLPRQILASFLSFVFIFVWHGAEFYLFIWTFLNYLGILLESMAARISAMPCVKAFERRRLSPVNSRRVRALVTIPSFAMSIFAIFIFFGGSDVGTIYLYKVLFYGPGVASVFAVLYTYIQSSIEVAINEAEKVKQN